MSATPTPSYPNPLSSANVAVAAFDNGSGVPQTVTPANPLPVSGSAAVGSAPTAPPLSVSGVDGSGNKQHIKVDTAGNVNIVGAANRTATTSTITSGTSVTPTIDLLGTSLVGFIMPAAWTAAALNIEVSADNSTWAAGVYDGSGLAVSSWSSPVAGAAYAVDTLSMIPFRYIRFRSGTSAVPANQGADRVFTVITRPLA